MPDVVHNPARTHPVQQYQPAGCKAGWTRYSQTHPASAPAPHGRPPAPAAHGRTEHCAGYSGGIVTSAADGMKFAYRAKLSEKI